MPEGQFTGKRAVYIYDDDQGNQYLITRDETNGDIAECGLTKGTTANIVGIPTIPARLKPRYVLWQGEIAGELKSKRLTCSRTSTAFSAVGSTAFDVDGSTGGATSGRVGEKETFLKV